MNSGTIQVNSNYPFNYLFVFFRWAREETGEKKQTKTLNLSKVRTKMFVFIVLFPPINVDHVMMLKGLFLSCSCTRITHWCGMVTQ